MLIDIFFLKSDKKIGYLKVNMGDWFNKTNSKQLDASIQIYIFKTLFGIPPPPPVRVR